MMQINTFSSLENFPGKVNTLGFPVRFPTLIAALRCVHLAWRALARYATRFCSCHPVSEMRAPPLSGERTTAYAK